MVFGLPISPAVLFIAVLPLVFRLLPFLVPGWDGFESYSLWDPVEMNRRVGEAREDVVTRWVNVGYWKVRSRRWRDQRAEMCRIQIAIPTLRKVYLSSQAQTALTRQHLRASCSTLPTLQKVAAYLVSSLRDQADTRHCSWSRRLTAYVVSLGKAKTTSASPCPEPTTAPRPWLDIS
jgi:hypothetical protein